MTTQPHLFDAGEEAATEYRRRDERAGKTPLANPLIRIFGAGPEGSTCGDCIHLWRRQLAGTYFKCGLHSMSGSATTDHRLRWQGCGRWELDTRVDDPPPPGAR